MRAVIFLNATFYALQSANAATKLVVENAVRLSRRKERTFFAVIVLLLFCLLVGLRTQIQVRELKVKKFAACKVARFSFFSAEKVEFDAAVSVVGFSSVCCWPRQKSELFASSCRLLCFLLAQTLVAKKRRRASDEFATQARFRALIRTQAQSYPCLVSGLFYVHVAMKTREPKIIA